MKQANIKYQAEYLIALTSEFAKAHGLTDAQAFRYIDRFKGIDFVIDHYAVVHTQSFYDMVEAVGDVCKRNGGQIAPQKIENKDWLRQI